MASNNGNLPLLTYALNSTVYICAEVSAMSIKTRKYLMIFALSALASALYGTAAYRVEQTRMQPSFAISCHQDQCVPHTGSFSALR